MKNNGNRLQPKRLPLNGLGALFVLALSLVCAASSAEIGYLPRLGPAPYRFLAVIAPSTNKVVLPKAAVLPEPEPVAVQMARAKAAFYGPPAPDPQQLQQMNVVLPTNSPEPALDPTVPESVISPQMLLRYFTRTSNGTATVVAPVNFTPPRPANTSSSATFSTGP